MLYVLFVQSGRELTIIEELRRKKITAYCPRQLKAERRRGDWQYAERIVFTGYVQAANSRSLSSQITDSIYFFYEVDNGFCCTTQTK